MVPEIDLDNLIEFTRGIIGIKTEKRKSILEFGEPLHTPTKIAATRIFDTNTPYVKHTPTLKEIEFEKRDNTKNVTVNPNTIYYDGVELQNVFTSLIPKEELTQDIFHVIFTDKLCCTYDDTADGRYHGRALIGSNPAIISTTGIIEAPAKPKEYYMELITRSRLGEADTDSLKAKYAGEYLEYHDKRLPVIVEGYFLQALLYYVSGQAFCDKKDCRAFNAHWQKDLLYSQIKVGKLCEKHQKILESMNNLN